MTEDEYTQHLQRLSIEEVRRIIALDLSVKSLSSGSDAYYVTRRADQFLSYIKGE